MSAPAPRSCPPMSNRSWRTISPTSIARYRSRAWPVRATACNRMAVLATFDTAESAPLALVESGPAGGVAGAVRVGEALGEADILYLDVGGTTAKCSLVREGRPVLKSEYKLEWTRSKPGYPVQVPVVDIVEIGAGGGSIVHVGGAGELQVGPQSAGADPGPACYNQGGDEPTVTDAKLLTGAIDPHRFAGGRMQLDRDLSVRAFEKIATHLGSYGRRRRRGGHPPRRGQHDQCAEAGDDSAGARPTQPDNGRQRRWRPHACRQSRPRARRQADRDPALRRSLLGMGHAGRATPPRPRANALLNV